MTELTKWPRLLVVGEPVTREQANEILIRTDTWWISTNDQAWKHAVCGAAGIALGEYGFPTRKSMAEFERRHHLVSLCFVNNDRIASSWIGGPHGWCDWDGTIGCATFNIGKWPSAQEVTEDWEAIAAAFPYLDLRAQLVPDEGASPTAAVEWRVAGGAVETSLDPVELLTRPVELGETAVLSILAPGGERGVTLDRLREALTQVASTGTA